MIASSQAICGQAAGPVYLQCEGSDGPGSPGLSFLQAEICTRCKPATSTFCVAALPLECSSGSPPPKPFRPDERHAVSHYRSPGLVLALAGRRHIRHYDLRHPCRPLVHEIAPIVLVMEPAGLKKAVDAFNFDAAERMQTKQHPRFPMLQPRPLKAYQLDRHRASEGTKAARTCFYRPPPAIL